MQEAMKSALDRIIVKDNARMMEIIQWYIDNQDYLESKPFQKPFLQGLICLNEEMMDISFEPMGDKILFKIYPGQKDKIMCAFLYDPEKDIVVETRWPKNIPPERLQMLKLTEQFDKTCKKEAFKYRVLMFFAAYYHDEVVIDKAQEKRLDKHTRATAKKPGIPAPLVRKTYIIDPKTETLKKPADPNKKRDYTKPDHEVTVRGYYRKNGTWVAPYSRYKDKDNKGPKNYKA